MILPAKMWVVFYGFWHPFRPNPSTVPVFLFFLSCLLSHFSIAFFSILQSYRPEEGSHLPSTYSFTMEEDHHLFYPYACTMIIISVLSPLPDISVVSVHTSLSLSVVAVFVLIETDCISESFRCDEIDCFLATETNFFTFRVTPS